MNRVMVVQVDTRRPPPSLEEGRYGLFPHDLARDVLDTDLRWRDPPGYADLHRRVRAHIVGRIRASSGRGQRKAMSDLTYLHRRNPVMAPLFDWGGLGAVEVDPLGDGDDGGGGGAAGPAGADAADRGEGAGRSDPSGPVGRDRGDRAAVLALAAAELVPDEAALVRHWLDRQPESFLLFRVDGRVVGFTAILRLDRAAADDLAADPATRALDALWAREDPPRPGEATTMTRFMAGCRDLSQAPSPAWEGFCLAQALHPLRTPGLGWDLVAAFTSPSVDPLFRYVDYPRRPEAEFTSGGEHHLVFGHDWRRLGVDAFMEMMGDRELDDGSGIVVPAGAAPPGSG